MNTEQNEEQVRNVEPKCPGAALKQAREAIGLTAQDVADRLRLRVSVIQDLEADCYNDIQVTTFIRGYIRSYAKLVGLDPNTLLSDYQPAQDSEDAVQKMQSFSRKTRIEEHDNRVMRLTWIILTVVISLTAFWWWQNQEDDSQPVSASLFTVQETDKKKGENVVVDADFSIIPAENQLISSDNTLPSKSVSVQTAVVLQKSITTPSVSTVDAKQQILALKKNVKSVSTSITSDREKKEAVPSLTMSFSEDCWVDVSDANGKRLVAGIKSAGDTLVLSGRAPFKIVLGAPSAVELAYDGKKVDLRGYPSGRVARLSLPK